jgi:hypothetical protein
MTALDTVLSTTLERSRKKLIMASIKSNTLMAWAFATNRVEYEDGGHNITNPLLTGRNPNIGSYEYYGTVPVGQTDEFAKVTYTWSRVAGTVIISDQEQDENKGEAAVTKILDGKMKVLEESMKEKFSEYLYGAGAGTDPLGLAALIPNDPSTGTLGGINRATEPQWRTSSYDFDGGVTAGNIEEVFDDILLDLTVKGEKPDIILVGRNIYRLYRQAVRDKVMIPLNDTKNGGRMVDLGFAGLSHQNIPLVYDEDCNVNQAYFINANHLKLHILKHVNMKKKELTAPWNVDAVGKRVVWQGQWCMWKAHRTHATLINE